MQNWGEQLGGMLDKYKSGGGQDASAVKSDFEQVTRNVDHGSLAAGLLSAFRSQGPGGFGPMVKTLFMHGDPHQKAGLLTTLLSTMGPGLAKDLLGRINAGPLQAAAARPDQKVTVDEGTQVSPDAVQQIATEAATRKPEVMDQVSGFAAGHPQLVKNLEGGHLASILSHVAGQGRV